MARESEIENYLIWTVERMGGTAYKFKSLNHRGVSDRIACLPDGTVWFIELKTARGQLSPLQKIFATHMAELNQNYATLRSKTEIDEWASRLGHTKTTP